MEFTKENIIKGLKVVYTVERSYATGEQFEVKSIGEKVELDNGAKYELAHFLKLMNNGAFKIIT